MDSVLENEVYCTFDELMQAFPVITINGHGTLAAVIISHEYVELRLHSLERI